MANPFSSAVQPDKMAFIREFLNRKDISLQDLARLKNEFLSIKQELTTQKQDFQEHTARLMSTTNFTKINEVNRSQNPVMSSRPPISQKNPFSKGQHSDKINLRNAKNKTNENLTQPITSNESQNFSFSSQKLEKQKHTSKQQLQQVRAKIEKMIPIEPNEIIWDNTDIFFKNLPPLNKLEDLLNKFSTSPYGCPIDTSKIFGQLPVEHWTVRINRLAKEKGLKQLPHVNINANRLHTFWKQNKLSFQIENIQKKQDSTLQRLINALVESPPIERGDKDIEIPKRARRHMLAPQIPYIPYLSLDFEQKLELELNSLGLGVSGDTSTKDPNDNAFTKEIQSYTEQLNQIIPKIGEYREKILEEMPEIIKKDKEMRETKEIFFKKYAEIQTPK